MGLLEAVLVTAAENHENQMTSLTSTADEGLTELLIHCLSVELRSTKGCSFGQVSQQRCDTA